MALTVKNSSALITPTGFKWKVLLFGLPGVGKTSWASGAPNPGFVACETGHGKGLLSVAEKGLAYVEPSSYQDFEEIAAGRVFADKDTIVVDSLTAMTRTFIKDYALTVPRGKGESKKRSMGVPELDDYGVIGEVTRRQLAKLLELDKHIIVTCLLRPYQEANPSENKEERPNGPDLPGQLFLASAAMFDTVMWLRNRPAVKKDPKTGQPLQPPVRYNERFFQTEGDSKAIAKCRSVIDGKSLLFPEEVVDGARGSWQDLFNKIIAGYGAKSASRD